MIAFFCVAKCLSWNSKTKECAVVVDVVLWFWGSGYFFCLIDLCLWFFLFGLREPDIFLFAGSVPKSCTEAFVAPS